MFDFLTPTGVAKAFPLLVIVVAKYEACGFANIALES